MIGKIWRDIPYIHLQASITVKASLQNGDHSRFAQITANEINEIKIYSILKNTKDPTTFGVKLFQGIYFIFSIYSVLQQRK